MGSDLADIHTEVLYWSSRSNFNEIIIKYDDLFGYLQEMSLQDIDDRIQALQSSLKMKRAGTGWLH